MITHVHLDQSIFCVYIILCCKFFDYITTNKASKQLYIREDNPSYKLNDVKFPDNSASFACATIWQLWNLLWNRNNLWFMGYTFPPPNQILGEGWGKQIVDAPSSFLWLRSRSTNQNRDNRQSQENSCKHFKKWIITIVSKVHLQTSKMKNWEEIMSRQIWIVEDQ